MTVPHSLRQIVLGSSPKPINPLPWLQTASTCLRPSDPNLYHILRPPSPSHFSSPPLICFAAWIPTWMEYRHEWNTDTNAKRYRYRYRYRWPLQNMAATTKEHGRGQGWSHALLVGKSIASIMMIFHGPRPSCTARRWPLRRVVTPVLNNRHHRWRLLHWWEVARCRRRTRSWDHREENTWNRWNIE